MNRHASGVALHRNPTSHTFKVKLMFLETRDGTEIFFRDLGDGPPVVLIHGWPLNGDMWEYQIAALVEAGFRCIAYDRRGFGQSDQPWEGYDYDTFADDLADLIEELELTDVTLIGFSMGGGEVARYIGTYGTERISRAVLLGAVPPFLLQTEEHPAGAPMSVFDGMIAGIKADRPQFFADFSKGFYGLPATGVSQGILDWTLMHALKASPKGTVDCVTAFGTTDFREDLKKFDVPTLILHGEADAIVPVAISARESARLIPGAVLKEYPGAPHGLFFTHKDAVNADILAFLAE
jgi:pimeloyl-ACP methyl ester carboxylesterase